MLGSTGFPGNPTPMNTAITSAFNSSKVFGSGNFIIITATGPVTIPPGVSKARVRIYGATGAGAQNNGSNLSNATGAGGGGFSCSVLDFVPGQVIQATIGAAGVTPGSAGGTTSFGNFLSVVGSTGGNTSNSAPASGGLPGYGVGGQINYSGGPGGDVIGAITNCATGGGGAATEFGDGGKGGDATVGGSATGGGAIAKNAGGKTTVAGTGATGGAGSAGPAPSPTAAPTATNSAYFAPGGYDYLCAQAASILNGGATPQAAANGSINPISALIRFPFDALPGGGGGGATGASTGQTTGGDGGHGGAGGGAYISGNGPANGGNGGPGGGGGAAASGSSGTARAGRGGLGGGGAAAVSNTGTAVAGRGADGIIILEY